MLYLIVYLYDTYGRFINIVVATAAVTAIIALLSLAPMSVYSEYSTYSGDGYYKNYRRIFDRAVKVFKISFKTFIVAILMFTFLPTKHGLAMLGGVYVGTQVFDKLEHSTLVDKSVKILNVELDRYLTEALDSSEAKALNKPVKQENGEK